METTISGPAVLGQLPRRVDRLVVPAGRAYGVAGEYCHGGDDLYLVYGAFRARVVYDAAAVEGDQHPESAGGKRDFDHEVVEQGFCVAGWGRVPGGDAGRVVVESSVVTGLCVPNRVGLVDLCTGGHGGDGGWARYGGTTGDADGDGESGEVFA